MTGISIKYELNSNTIIMVLGFLGSLVTLVFLVSDSQHLIAENARRIDAHDLIFKAIGERLDAIDKRDTDIRDLQFQVGAQEKAIELQDVRTSRVVESYSNKFTEISGQMNTMLTQQALINQAMQRLEAIAKPPPVP